MSALWDHGLSSAQPELSREFLASPQLFVSNVAAIALRKPRKKSERRESLLTGATDDSRKFKESILNSAKSGSGQWKDVTCKSTADMTRCILSLYLDGTTLYQTVFVHLLRQTDIRVVDNSLFFRKACLGIYCPSDKRQTTAETNEPIYLQFNNADMCGTWAMLLKSYAIPEVYGPQAFGSDDSAFRMWRQIEITVIQGRNLGDTRPDDNAASFDSQGHESSDFYVSCEILFHETVCGRTTSKKNLVSPLWHETITLNDLPPFSESDYLEIRVWKEKKSSKPIFLGAVKIAPRTFPHIIDQGWYPVLQSNKGKLATSTQAGEIQLKVCVNQEIILPQKAYVKLRNTLDSRNFLDWITDFQKKLKVTTLSTHLVAIAAARNVLVEQVIEYAARDMERTPFSQETLFRGNTTLTKVMEICMVWYGKAFLEASIGRVIRRLYGERVAIELDVDRGNQTVDPKQLKQLVDWCGEIWAQIYSMRNECPEEIRTLFGTIRKLVEKRMHMDDTNSNKYPHLHWQSVSVFCFLRFIVPAILHPHLFGICPGIPSPPIKRTLTRIAKVIQSLANLNTGQHRDNLMSMKELQDFLEENRHAMFDYLSAVSGESPTRQKMAGDSWDRLNIINTLRERIVFMPPLKQESIPIPPHFSDVPKHLASIVTGVYRQEEHIKSAQDSKDEGSEALSELYLRCVEIQKEAAVRVIRPAFDERSLSSAASDLHASSTTTKINAPKPKVAATRGAAARRQTLTGGIAGPSNIIHSSSSPLPESPLFIMHHKSPSSDSQSPLKEGKVVKGRRSMDPLADISDDTGSQRGKIRRGILRW